MKSAGVGRRPSSLSGEIPYGVFKLFGNDKFIDNVKRDEYDNRVTDTVVIYTMLLSELGNEGSTIWVNIILCSQTLFSVLHIITLTFLRFSDCQINSTNLQCRIVLRILVFKDLFL